MLKIKKFKLRNKFKMSENSCLLCFSSVPPLEKIHLFDYSETNMISAADLIKLNFSFFEVCLIYNSEIVLLTYSISRRFSQKKYSKTHQLIFVENVGTKWKCGWNFVEQSSLTIKLR